MRTFFAVLLVTSGALAAPTDFDRLKAIAGEWTTTTASGKPFAIRYGLVSADSVLVETYGVGGGHETLTVFHPDAAKLVATHYCAQGNQPRLRASEATERHWVFDYWDATNLPDKSASHLVRLELTLSADGKGLVRTETYEEKGKPDVATLKLQRR